MQTNLKPSILLQIYNYNGYSEQVMSIVDAIYVTDTQNDF